jgi:hydrophobic/amphiphilic exporter-1 (mainly G- bacteria), HAE1 family
MGGHRGWYGRPVTALTVLLIVLALSLFAASSLRLGPASEQRCDSFSVTIEHFGIDSREIERTITCPLEDELSLIPGTTELRSVSEYGKARVFVLSGKSASRNEVFLRLRDAVERVYSRLPSTVQRPEISSSSVSRRPVFVAAVKARVIGERELLVLAESRIKPSFQKIPGVGEVEVGGGETREIHVRVDTARAAQKGLSCQDIALQLQRQDRFTPVGRLIVEGREIPLTLAGRLGTLDALANQPLLLPGGGTIPLSRIASVERGSREKESISRVDGREAIVLSVLGSGSANLISLSRALRAEAARWKSRGVEMLVILDRGLALETAISHMLAALVVGVVSVMVLLPLFVGELRRLVVLALSLPSAMLVTAGLLSLAGISLDEYVLFGLAVGIGTVVDGGVILSEARSTRAASSLLSPLFAAMLATLVALVPLLFLESVSPGIRQVAASIGLILAVSLALAAAFVPAICLTGGTTHTQVFARIRRRLARRSKRAALRILHVLVDGVIRRRRLVLGCAALAAGSLAVSLLAAGRDFSPPLEDDAVFAHVEVEPQATVQSVDRRMSAYAGDVARVQGVVSTETISRRGSAEMAVRFDPRRVSRERIGQLMQGLGGRIPGGFAYLAEGITPGERPLELAVLGEDGSVLQELARAAARELAARTWVSRVVLNFKDPPPSLVLEVDHERAARMGTETMQIAGALRWALRGPVALKWIESDRESDLRVMDTGARVSTRRSVLHTPLGGPALVVGAVVRPRQGTESARIYRLNRQRAALLTVHSVTRSLDDAVSGIRGALARVSLPRGYAFELDREALRLNREIRYLWASLVVGVFFVFVILAAFSESLAAPLLILSVLPATLACPALALFLMGQPIRVATLVGLIMLCGMAATNSILIVHEFRARLSRLSRWEPRTVSSCIHVALRKRLRPLLITSTAAVSGTFPLLFFRTGSAFLGSLAFVVFWGVIGSLLSTVFVVPALGSVMARSLRRFPRQGRGAQ